MSEPVRILIVEDLETDFKLAQREIRRSVKNCVLERVQTRQDFIQKLDEFKPDLILSDYSLPHFNGMEALQLTQKHTPLTPFIIWTGSMSEDIAVECMKAGAHNYILKDNLKRLSPAVTHALAEGQLLIERRQAEEKYQSIFENSPEGIFQSTPEGRFIKLNPAMARIYGYDSPQEMLESITDIASQLYADPQDRQKFIRLFDSDGVVVNLEMRNCRKDGSIFWTSTSARAVRDAGGKLLYYEGFLQDITERKLAEEKLRENEQRLRVALKLVDLAVFNLDRELRYTWMYQPQLGYNTEQVVGHTDAELLPARDSAQVMSIKQRVLETGIGARGEMIIHAPEKTLTYDLIVEPVTDTNGNIMGLTGATLDITARKRAELERQAQLEIVQGLTSTNDLPDFMRLIHHAVKKIVRAENFFAVFYNKETGLFEEIYCVDQYDPPAAPSKLEKSITSYVFRTGQPVLMDQALFDQLIERGEVELVGTNSAAWLGVPLKAPNEIFGVIAVQDYENPNCYSDRDLDFLTSIGAQAALAIERKQAEEKLRQNEAQYRYLFENNPHPMWAYDLETMAFLAVNDAAVEKYGYSRAEFLSMTIADIRPAEDVAHLMEDVAQPRPVLQRSGEWRHKRKNGTLIDVEINSHTLTLNGREAALVVAQDITDRKQAEEKVRAQEKRFRALIENSLDNISLLATDGTLLWENPAVNRNLGYEQDEFVGHNIFELVHPDDIGWTSDLFSKLLRASGSHQNGTFRLRHHNGTWRWTEAIAANMLDDPSVQAVVINYRDITERKQAEIELQQRSNDLALINAINEAVIRGESLDAIARLLATELKRIFSSEGCTIYLLSPDEKSVIMQQFFLPEEVKRKIEKVIGGTIPLVQIPLKEEGIFHKVLRSRQGLITSDPHELQGWISEFTATTFLPTAVQGAVRKLTPQIFHLLKIQSAILVPLISDGKPIGLLDVSSRNLFSMEDLKRIESLSRQLTSAIQRQQADERVRRSEAFLQSVQNALSAHIAILDENGTIIQVNAAWRKFAEQNGYNGTGHGVGLNYLDICDSALGMNAEEAPLTANAIREVLSGRRREAWVEYPCHSPEEKRWFILRVTKFLEGGRTWVVLAHENVTERKQAEEAIRESQIQYQNLVETSHDLIWSVDGEGCFTYLNQAAREIYGYEPEELIGHSYFEIMDTQDKYGSLEKFKEAIGQIDEFREVETFVRHRNGDLVILSANSVVTRDVNGKAIAVSGSSHNITERKQAEEKMRESEERYRALYEDSPVSIWEEDFSEVKSFIDSLKAEGVADLRKYFTSKPEALNECALKIKVTDLNNAALQLYGAHSKTELIEATNRTLSTGEQENNLEDFIAIADGRLGNNWEGKDETLTGEPLEISLKWSVVPGHEHDYSKVIVTVTDITARKQAERDLRASEERYRILLSQLPAIVYTDAAVQGMGVTQFVSPQIEDILGFTPEEWIKGGFALWETQIHPEDRKQVVEQYLSCIQRGEPFHCEYRIRTKRGETLWVLDQSRMLFDAHGHPLSSHGIVYDITQRKLFEKTLRESEEKFSSAFEYAPIGKALVALDGRWLKVNPALCDIVGYSEDELMQVTFQDITHPDDLETDLALVAQLRDGQISTYQMEKRYRHKQGHYVWILLSVSLICDDAGNPLYFISQVQDITERRRVEENNRRRMAELEALYENGLAISQLLDPKLISQKVADILAEKLHWHHVAIRLYDATTNKLEVTALKRPGFDEEHLQEEIIHLNTLISDAGKGLTGWAIKQRLPVRNDFLTNDPRYTETYPGMHSGLYVPILAGERVLGAISVESEMESVFTEQDERLLTTLANQAAIAIENAQLYLMVQRELGVRQETELRLRESEARQNGIIEAAMDGIITVDDSQSIVLFNAAAEAIFGYPAKEAIGKPLEMFIPDRYRTAHRKHIKNFGETGVTTRNMNALGEVSGLRIDGSEFPLEASISQIMVAGVKLYTIILRDITERKHAEEALLASEENYRLLAEDLEIRVNERTAEVQDLYNNAPCGYHSLDAEGRIVRINQTELAWLGYAREEIIGQAFQDILTAESRFTFQKSFPAFKQHGWVKDLEFDLQRKDGSMFPVLVSATAIYDRNGNYVSSRSTLFDNTERKYALEALRLANAEMKRALRTKDEFLANMSHELRTPLNAVLGLSESLLEQSAGPLNERQQKYLATVNESGHHLLELINDILDLAKIEAGQITLNPGMVDVKTTCQSSLRMIQQLARKKNQTVEMAIEDEIGFIWADERRLKQMIVNLLSNAVKFTSEGGKLGLSAQLDYPAAKVLITVWDHGIGIREEDLARLFQPFVQLDSSLARESGGTGLGLALVAQMARLHGGSISVSSQPGQGSQFTITLPWESTITGDIIEKFKVTGRFPKMKRLAGEKRTILVVEDTDSVVMLVRDYLELSGYKVEVARDGVSGVSKAISLHPDLILMDVQMPGMDGLEATRRIRREVTLRDTPIIALTALAMPSDREKCIEAGMDDYLSKPINLKELVKTIQAYLSRAGRES